MTAAPQNGPQNGTGPAAGPGPASPEGPAPERPGVRIVSGSLSDAELAAVSVALAAVNAASRAEAAERALADGGAEGGTGWDDAVHRLPRMHDARSQATPAAWQFSHR